jgi:hypothetical protein
MDYPIAKTRFDREIFLIADNKSDKVRHGGDVDYIGKEEFRVVFTNIKDGNYSSYNVTSNGNLVISVDDGDVDTGNMISEDGYFYTPIRNDKRAFVIVKEDNLLFPKMVGVKIKDDGTFTPAI